MTDRLEAARAFVAAGDALNSPEHQADVEQLREISNRVTARQEAYDAAQEALFAADRTCKPADNTEAEAVIDPKQFVQFHGELNEKLRDERLAPAAWDFGAGTNLNDEFSSSRANGAYAED